MIPVPVDIAECVARALAEDITSGDVTADLIPAEQCDNARIICREAAVIAGTDYADEAFRQVDERVQITWHVRDGEAVEADTLLCELNGPSRALLTGERTALNFLQTLSGTATLVQQYVQAVEGTAVKLLDTRKTLPGLRLAQKYAVRCGGGHNHRVGLFDAFLIKENHIAAAGGVAEAIAIARSRHPELLLEVEVENFDELSQALSAKPDRIMLDNFSCADMSKAVAERPPGVEYEASGGITLDNLREVAETGVDYISLGCLTKDVKAIDLSMRLVD